MAGAAGHHRAPAREGAGTPVELPGIAGAHLHRRRFHPQHLGDDLREAGEVPLALGAHSGGEPDRAARLDGDAGSFIWPDAGSLYV